MSPRRTENLRVRGTTPLVAPRELKRELPLPPAAADFVAGAREVVERILSGHDPRLLVVVGPCSIHDLEAGVEYARRLRALSDAVSDQLVLLMRAYFEKPRTVVGWKGLINDPHLDGSFDMAEGLCRARRFLIELASVGVPAATEMLEPITPQYIADLVTWASIGARTTESQTHRQMASGLSMPIGYKNGTDGDVQTAVDALVAARHPHSFLGIDETGRTCVIHTAGNPWGHLILRGGRSGPNYSPEHVERAVAALARAGAPERIVIDCSHANSGKDPRRQRIVWDDVLRQRAAGRREIVGLMLESHLRAGRQDLGDDPRRLAYGVSITDACIGWEETEELLRGARARLAA